MLSIPTCFPALDALTVDALTLEERAELERAVDGPITPAMIADKLRGRAPSSPAPETSPQYLRTLHIWARADLKFYRDQMVDLENEIVELMADRDALYSDAEKDRKTRHIAALNRQRDTLRQHCAPYDAIILDIERKHTALQSSISE
jgi:hypothetical protein